MKNTPQKKTARDKVKKSIYRIISLSLLIIIIYVFINYKDSVIEIVTTVNIKWFIFGIFFYFANYFLRALRFHQYLLFDTSIKYLYLLKSAGFHGFYNYFLPVRSGDATLPFFLNVYCSIPLSSGIKVLLKARLQDIITLGIILCLVVFFYKLPLISYTRFIFLIFGLFLISVPYLLIYLVRNNLGILPKKMGSNMVKNPPGYPKTLELFTSLLIWCCTGGTIFSVVKSLDIPINFLDIWFLISVQLPLQLLPVQGLANAGNHELGWGTALKILGVDFDSSVNFALSSHLILIIYVLILGGVSLLLPPIKRPSS